MIDTINLAYLLYYELFEYWQFAITLTVDIPDLTQFTFRDVPRYIYAIININCFWTFCCNAMVARVNQFIGFSVEYHFIQSRSLFLKF